MNDQAKLTMRGRVERVFNGRSFGIIRTHTGRYFFRFADMHPDTSIGNHAWVEFESTNETRPGKLPHAVKVRTLP